MKFKHLLAVFLVTAATFFACAWIYGKLNEQNLLAVNSPATSSIFKSAKFVEGNDIAPLTNFENAAAKATPAVVHIKVLKRVSAPAIRSFQWLWRHVL